mgnify:CR=1 FL=1
MATSVTSTSPVLLAQANTTALPADASAQPSAKATEGLRSVKVVESQTQNGSAAFTLPVSQADVKSVQVLDLDMLIVLGNGEGILLREGAFLATTNATQKVVFGGGGSLLLSDLLQKVGVMKPSDAASFRLSSTEVKLGKSEAPGGQGLNLGLADAGALAQVLRARQAWRGVGDEKLLRRYERARKADVLAMGSATDGLQLLFGRQGALWKSVRNWGMDGFDRSGPLKRWVARQAMGRGGPDGLPR